MLKIRLNQVRPNPWNCNFLETYERASLKQRMKEDGAEKTPPIIVRKVTSEAYELVDGEQRWDIAGELGWEAINAIEREADDLQTKVLCVGYNRWRGRLNWFKLCDVLKKDVAAGVNVYKSYSQALSSKEIESVLSLVNLVPDARKVLEESIKRCPEITLEHLHLLSLFPENQQESLVEKFKSPVVTQALLQTLNPFLPKNQPCPFVGEYSQQPSEGSRGLSINGAESERAARLVPGQSFSHRSEFFKEKDHLLDKQRTVSKMLKQLDSTRAPNQASSLGAGEVLAEVPERRVNVHQALLIDVAYDCECGRHYRVNFKNLSVLVQKDNELFEHVDVKPRTFQVHCDKCGSNHEFVVDGKVGEVKQVFCRRCKPFPRKGILDVNSGEITWLV